MDDDEKEVEYGTHMDREENGDNVDSLEGKLPLYDPTPADCHLQEGYQYWVHVNDRIHLG